MKHCKDNEATSKVAVAYVALGRRIETVDAIAGREGGIVRMDDQHHRASRHPQASLEGATRVLIDCCQLTIDYLSISPRSPVESDSEGTEERCCP